MSPIRVTTHVSGSRGRPCIPTPTPILYAQATTPMAIICRMPIFRPAMNCDHSGPRITFFRSRLSC
jgi:hypothetical protein